MADSETRPKRAARARRPGPLPKIDPAIRRGAALDRLISTSGRPRGLKPADLFRAAKPAPGVLPEGAQMAMDEAPGVDIGQWAAQGNFFTEGLQFLGYPYLSDLAQRAEYRRGVEIIAGDMTRQWIEFQATGDDAKSAKIAKIEKRLGELRASDRVNAMIRNDGFFGRGHLFLDTGDTKDTDELLKPIGDGREDISRAKVSRKHPLTALRVIEPVWTYPTTYNANDPFRDDWYNPSTWYVMGKGVHASRLLTLIGRPVPDLLKPSYAFGGLPLTQLAKAATDIWLRTRDGVGDIISSFTTYVLSTNMTAQIQTGGEEELLKRVALFLNWRDNRGLMVTDKETEDFKNVSAPLSGLDILQQQAQEHVATALGIPFVKYMGDQQAGLNSTSEGVIRMYYDTISAAQESQLRPIIDRIINFVQLSLFDEVDDAITWTFRPLWEMDEKERAEIEEIRARTDQTYADMGAISQGEVRRRLADDPESPYDGLDPDDMPDLLEEEDEGFDPRPTKGTGGEDL